MGIVAIGVATFGVGAISGFALSSAFGAGFGENTKPVDGEDTGKAGFVTASDDFVDGCGVASNALTIDGDSAAMETFSFLSFAPAFAFKAPNIDAVLAACPNTVSGFETGIAELKDCGVFTESGTRLEMGFGFSNATFSLFAKIDAVGTDCSGSFGIASFGGLLNVNGDLSALTGSTLTIAGEEMGFAVGVNVNEAV